MARLQEVTTCAMKGLHSSTLPVSPAPNGHPGILPTLAFFPSPDSRPQNLLIPALCLIS